MPAALRLAILAACLLSAGAARAGEARCWFENGALVVPAAFGTIAGDFEIDTTAPKSLLHEDQANGAGLTEPTARDRLTVAGEHLRDVTLTLANFNERQVGFPTGLSGVIGVDLLALWVVQIDFEPCRVRLLRRPPALGADAVRLPIRMADGIPAVDATASDATRSLRGLFAVDLASAGVRFVPDRIAFSRALAEGVDPTLRFRPPARLRGLTLGAETFVNTPAGTAQYPLPGLDGAIGVAVWSRYRVTLDIRGKQLILERR